MNYLVQSGGFDASTGALRIDFSMIVNHAYVNTPRYPLKPRSTYSNAECVDSTTFMTDYGGFPLPIGGGVEGASPGSPTYAGCKGDCHVLVVDHDQNLIYESYQSDFDGRNFITSCVVVWNMCATYTLAGIGEQCTSTDAGGLCVAAGVVTQSEVQLNNVNHAMRFILYNGQIGNGTAPQPSYVHPANHLGGPSSPNPNAPPYGTRFRLKKNVNLSGLPHNLQVICRALQTYGAILTDGDNSPAFSLSFQVDGYDPNTNSTWNDLGISQRVLSDNGINATSFEVVITPDYPTMIHYKGNCDLLPIPTTTCSTVTGTQSGGSASNSGSASGSSSEAATLKDNFCLATWWEYLWEQQGLMCEL